MNRFELLPDEAVILENPKHWRNYIIPVLAMALCLIVLVIRIRNPYDNMVNSVMEKPLISPQHSLYLCYVELALLGIAQLYIAYVMIETAFTRYYVTNRRIVVTEGFLNVRIAEMLISTCQTVSLSQKFIERLFNSGDILCISAGSNLLLEDVYRARAFRQTIMRMMARPKEEED